MVLPGHLAGGYLATYSLLLFSHISFSPLQTGILYAIGIVAGEGPDVDLIRFYFEEISDKITKAKSHRDYFTHAPFFWLAAYGLITVIGLLSGSLFTIFLGLVAMIGALSHFVFDSIDNGVMWFWPLSKKRFGIFKKPEASTDNLHTFSYYWKFITREYYRYWTFYVEILVTIVALFTAFK